MFKIISKHTDNVHVPWKYIAPHPFCQPFLIPKTWYLTNFSGFYVYGNSYHKLTGIVIHYKDVSLR